MDETAPLTCFYEIWHYFYAYFYSICESQALALISKMQSTEAKMVLVQWSVFV